MSSTVSTLRRWSVVAVGVTLLIVSVSGATVSGHELFVQSHVFLALAGVSITIASVGAWFVHRGFDPESTSVVTSWIVGTFAVGSLFGFGTIAVLTGGLGDGLALGASVYFGTFGGLVGVALGYNDARRRKSIHETQTARAAIEQATDAVAVLDSRGRFSLVNEAYCELYGFDSAARLLGVDWRQCYDESAIELIETEVVPNFRDQGTWEGEVTARRADGETFIAELSLTKLDTGQIVAICRDVSDRKERQREIERLALEGTRTGIWEWTIETGAINWNESLENLLGLEPGQFEGTYDAFVERVHPDDIGRVQSALDRALEDDEPYQAEFRMEHVDGSTIWVDARGHVVGEEKEESRRMLGIITDVTDRNRRKTALEEAQSQLQLALGGASPAFWEWNMETDEIHWNESMERLLGLDPGAFGGTLDAFMERTHTDDHETVHAAIQRGIENDGVFTTQLRLAGADGEYRWLDFRGKEIVDNDGGSRMVGLARDITERETYKRQLAERERQYSALIDNLPGLVYRCRNEQNWPMEFVGGECEELTGYTSDALDSGDVQWNELIHEDDRTDVWSTVQTALDADEPFELTYRLTTADGEVRWVWEQGRGISDDEGELLALEGFVTDVTDRREYERELEQRREAIENLHASTRTMTDAEDVEAVCRTAVAAAVDTLDAPLVTIWLADETGDRLVPTASSDAAEELFEDPPTYSAEQPSHSWEAYVDGEARVTSDPAASETVANPETPVQHEVVVPVGDRGVLNVATTADDPFDDVDVYVARLLASNLVAALDRADREAELRRQSDQLEFFNSILRHDVLNGMTVIQSRAKLLTEELTGRELEYAETIENWGENVTAVTGRVQRVVETLTAPAESTALEPVDASGLLKNHVERLQTMRSDVTFELDAPEAAYVTADELLSDVLGNVMSNAVEHNDEGALTVRASIDVGDDVTTIAVADDGAGIPDERSDSIFRRGETGHAKETGSGFGLFFVDAMVRKYGGTVHVTDNEHGGATFVLELPRATPEGATPSETAEQPQQTDSP